MSWKHRIVALGDPGARADWLPLWTGSPQRSAFSAYEYAACVVATFGLDCEIHIVETPEGQAEAGAVVFYREMGPYRLAVVPPFTPYNSILCRSSVVDAEVNQRRSALEHLLARLEERFHSIRIQAHPSLMDMRAATWRGWEVRPYYTYLAPLSAGTDPLAAWSKRTRRTANSERELFSVEEDAGSAAEVARIYTQSLSRQKHRLPTTPSRLAEHFERLRAAGMIRLFTVKEKDSGLLTGGVAVLVSGTEAHYWVGGSAPGSSMMVLLAGVLPRLVEAGVTSFDYDGANTPAIAEFKRQFGGTLVPYLGIHKTVRPELRLLDQLRAARTWLRRR